MTLQEIEDYITKSHTLHEYLDVEDSMFTVRARILLFVLPDMDEEYINGHKH
jgi:hypothetical protein